MKTALIGCGRIGFLLENDPLRYKPCTHFGGAVSAGLKVTSACDINGERLEAFSKSAGINAGNCHMEYKKLFQKEKPEIAIIATWTESHSEICLEAVRNHARIIVLEKPIAPDLKEAHEIITACSREGTVLIVNHERRFDSRYRKLKKIIDDGIIGAVKTVHASMLTGPYRGKSRVNEGGGPLLQDGTHMVDLIRFLFGEITSLEGNFSREGRTSGYEDRALALMKTETGIDVFLEAGGSREYFIFELEISGTAGKIIIGNGYEKIYKKKKSRFYTGFNDLDVKPFPVFKKNNCFNELYKTVKDIFSGKKTGTPSGGIDGYRSLEIIHSIYLSSHKGGKKIVLPIDQKTINLKKIFNL